jgi:hypothetical protein
MDLGYGINYTFDEAKFLGAHICLRGSLFNDLGTR